MFILQEIPTVGSVRKKAEHAGQPERELQTVLSRIHDIQEKAIIGGNYTGVHIKGKCNDFRPDYFKGSRTFEVKIVKASNIHLWYANKIGRRYKVNLRQHPTRNEWVFKVNEWLHIIATDCILINYIPAKTDESVDIISKLPIQFTQEYERLYSNG